MTFDIALIAILVLIALASVWTGIHYSRIRWAESGSEPSSTSIVMRNYGWLFGLAKYRSIRARETRGAHVAREAMEYRRSTHPGALGDVDTLLREAGADQSEPRP